MSDAGSDVGPDDYRGQDIDPEQFSIGDHLVYDREAGLWYDTEAGTLHESRTSPPLDPDDYEDGVALSDDSPILALFDFVFHRGDERTAGEGTDPHFDLETGRLVDADGNLLAVTEEQQEQLVSSANQQVFTELGIESDGHQSVVFDPITGRWYDQDGALLDDAPSPTIQIDDANAFAAANAILGNHTGVDGAEQDQFRSFGETLDSFGDAAPDGLVFDLRTNAFHAANVESEEFEQAVQDRVDEIGHQFDDAEQAREAATLSVLEETQIGGGFANLEGHTVKIEIEDPLNDDVQVREVDVIFNTETGAFYQELGGERVSETIRFTAGSELGQRVEQLGLTDGTADGGALTGNDEFHLDPDTGVARFGDQVAGTFGSLDDSDLIRLDAGGSLDSAGDEGQGILAENVRYFDPETGRVLDYHGNPLPETDANAVVFISHDKFNELFPDANDELESREGYVVDLRTGELRRDEVELADGTTVTLSEISTRDLATDPRLRRDGDEVEAAMEAANGGDGGLLVTDRVVVDESAGVAFNATTGAFYDAETGQQLDEPVDLSPDSAILTELAGQPLRRALDLEGAGKLQIDPQSLSLTAGEGEHLRLVTSFGDGTVVTTPSGSFDEASGQFFDHHGNLDNNQDRYVTVAELLEQAERDGNEAHVLQQLGVLVDERGELDVDRATLPDGTPVSALVVDRASFGSDDGVQITTINPEEWGVEYRNSPDGTREVIYIDRATGEQYSPDEFQQQVEADLIGEEASPQDPEPEQPAAPQPPTADEQPEPEQPAAEQPAPETEQPETEQPAPETEQPAAEQPAPEAEQPAAEQPAPETEQPAAEQPAPETEQPETEQPAAEQPAAEPTDYFSDAVPATDSDGGSAGYFDDGGSTYYGEDNNEGYFDDGGSTFYGEDNNEGYFDDGGSTYFGEDSNEGYFSDAVPATDQAAGYAPVPEAPAPAASATPIPEAPAPTETPAAASAAAEEAAFGAGAQAAPAPATDFGTGADTTQPVPAATVVHTETSGIPVEQPAPEPLPVEPVPMVEEPALPVLEEPTPVPDLVPDEPVPMDDPGDMGAAEG
ncbi:MAG: hypothetical protein AAF567_01070 [Actinomycetota bacterium]